MGEAARQQDPAVVDMVGYLRETLQEIDETIAELQGRRHGLAVKLAVIEAAGDPAVIEAAADYKDRAAADRPYENAVRSEDLVAEAHRRYGR